MSSDDAADLHRRAKAIFFELVESSDPNWRSGLDARCEHDPALVAEVVALMERVGVGTSDLAPDVRAPTGGLRAELSRLLSDGQGHDDERERTRGERLAPGQLFAERYRIELRIGVGGMGEVHRAHDELLGETVALKFVRSRFATADRMERLLAETSIARSISHPNVCRVYDAAEVDGEFFLSMEYVPGPDLGERLRREGRLDRDRCVELARQLVDALVAVHRAGLLHRDLKPTNVLFDAGGAARVSDFGLAIAASSATERDAASGTRAYMAPELLRGAPPTEASDVFALGLVLYEAITNRLAFRSSDEIRRAAENGALPPRPSVLVDDVDAVLEHVVQRCLAPDPSERPSATELQRALALDDPLEAVLSLGDAPTAETILGSRSRAPLTPTRARWMVAAFVAMLLITNVAARIHGEHVLPARSPSAMATEARRVLRSIGMEPDGAAAFETFAYATDPPEYTRSGHRIVADANSPDTGRWFWFRSATEPLWPRSASNQLFGFGRVRPFDPPVGRPGSTAVLFDSTGRLVFLDACVETGTETQVIGTQGIGTRGIETRGDARDDASDDSRGQPSSGSSADAAGADARSPDQVRDRPDVAKLLAMAGLAVDRLEATEPLPPRAAQADTHLAWRATGTPTRVELSLKGDRVVALELLEPIDGEPASNWSSRTLSLLNVVLIGALFAVTLPRAVRYFRSGRGDASVSLTMVLANASALFVAWILHADHPSATIDRLVFGTSGLFMAIASGVLLWFISIAVEPSAQKTWPRVFIGWSRFFRGHVGGPGVRSDLLTGLVLGAVATVALPLFGERAADIISTNSMLRDVGWSGWLASKFEALPSATLLGLEFLAVLTVLGWILRGRRAAIVGCLVVAWTLGAGSVGGGWPMVHEAVVMALVLACLVRYGLLAAVALILCRDVLGSNPPGPSGDAWYMGAHVASAVLLLVLVLCIAWPLVRGTSPTGRREPRSTDAG